MRLAGQGPERGWGIGSASKRRIICSIRASPPPLEFWSLPDHQPRM